MMLMNAKKSADLDMVLKWIQQDIDRLGLYLNSLEVESNTRSITIQSELAKVNGQLNSLFRIQHKIKEYCRNTPNNTKSIDSVIAYLTERIEYLTNQNISSSDSGILELSGMLKYINTNSKNV